MNTERTKENKLRLLAIYKLLILSNPKGSTSGSDIVSREFSMDHWDELCKH